MENIHVHHMTSTGKVRCSIVFIVNMFPNSSEDKSTRIDGLGIAARHLQDNCGYRRHNGDQPPTSFDSSTPLIDFRDVIRNIEFYRATLAIPRYRRCIETYCRPC